MYTVRSGDLKSAAASRFDVSRRPAGSATPTPRVSLPARDALVPANRAARSRPQPVAPAALHRGSTGAAVRALQATLVKLGQLSAAAAATGPGIFGPRTERAVQQFQAANRIKVTGVVGSYTHAALQRALEARTAAAGGARSAGALGRHSFQGSESV